MVKVMLVTGGSRGIGAATARLAARDGYDVTVNYARDAEAAARVVADIEKAGRKAVAIQADMGKPEDVARLFAQHDKAFGRLDAFVANAGIVNPVGRVDGTDVERLQRIIAINVTGVFLGCAEAVRRMSTRHGGDGGAIVTLSSVASRLGGPGMYIDYATTKGAVDAMTLGLAKEVAGEGIRVNAVRPGMIDTEIHHGIRTPEEYARTVATVPAGRAGSAEEVAETILWLCSDAASYVTMTLMEVSGAR
jgi:NAD(P)-dependent dehydrogenase (short-subunit alcohol dehydrogenase family)